MFVVCVVVIVGSFRFLNKLLKLALSALAVDLVTVIFQRTRSGAMSEVRCTCLFVGCDGRFRQCEMRGAAALI